MITVNGVKLCIDPCGRVNPEEIMALVNRNFDLEGYLDGRREELLDNSDRMDPHDVVRMISTIDEKLARKIELLLTGLGQLVRISGWLTQGDLKIPSFKFYSGDVEGHFRNPDHMMDAVMDDLYLNELSKKFFGVQDYGGVKSRMTKIQQEHYEKLVKCRQYFHVRNAVNSTAREEVSDFLSDLIKSAPDAYDIENTDWDGENLV